MKRSTFKTSPIWYGDASEIDLSKCYWLQLVYYSSLSVRVLRSACKLTE